MLSLGNIQINSGIIMITREMPSPKPIGTFMMYRHVFVWLLYRDIIKQYFSSVMPSNSSIQTMPDIYSYLQIRDDDLFFLHNR